jgi:hypothetical protein
MAAHSEGDAIFKLLSFDKSLQDAIAGCWDKVNVPIAEHMYSGEVERLIASHATSTAIMKRKRAEVNTFPFFSRVHSRSVRRLLTNILL